MLAHLLNQSSHTPNKMHMSKLVQNTFLYQDVNMVHFRVQGGHFKMGVYGGFLPFGASLKWPLGELQFIFQYPETSPHS